ncbi:hypothetical protein [Janthinobacterium sp.]|uniref:hypothetical protein n=1 Tax=Janthinobacterium sp. TaxID=1871054 RepID=UPI00293D7649|nr:hypothetical protein [Janthinobacterium sp.]
MKVLKNMEIIFTVALALAAASYVSFTRAPAQPGVSGAAIPVVVISAKRMTPQEKKQSLIEERQQMVATNERKS